MDGGSPCMSFQLYVSLGLAANCLLRDIVSRQWFSPPFLPPISLTAWIQALGLVGYFSPYSLVMSFSWFIRYVVSRAIIQSRISFMLLGGLQCDSPFIVCDICLGQQQLFVQVGLLLALSSSHYPPCAIASVYLQGMEIRLSPWRCWYPPIHQQNGT